MEHRVGERVRAVEDLGLFRPRVPAGTRGTIIAVSPALEIEVHFDNGRVELVRPERVRTTVDAAETLAATN